MNKVQISQTLDRDIPLDEAVFLAIVGMNDSKDGSNITASFHLAMAIQILQQEIAKIEKEYQEIGG